MFTPISLVVATLLALAGGGDTTPGGAAVINAITPILVVDEIEPSVPFWTERLGFETAASVPEGGPETTGPLGFAMFTNGALNVMYQTRRSIDDDMPGLLSGERSHEQVLFVIVADLDDIMKRMEGVEVTMPLRRTFYGMREFGVREPGGHLVTFAQPIEE
jgi:uncharacterized glyoxalase superfamily protein PhnB